MKDYNFLLGATVKELGGKDRDIAPFDGMTLQTVEGKLYKFSFTFWPDSVEIDYDIL